ASFIQPGSASLLFARNINLVQSAGTENEAMQTHIVVKVTYDLATIIDAERLSYRDQIWAEVKAGEAVGGQNISMNGAVRRVIDTSYFSPLVDISRKIKDRIGSRKIDCAKAPIA